MAGVGDTLGQKYLLTRLLGEGGMGAVFAATNTWTGKRVAIKTLQPDIAKKPEVVQRFWQEARASTKVQHPHIIDVLDVGIDEREHVPFIVQEYLEGETLKDALERRGAFSAREAIDLLAPVFGALVAAHCEGVIHRDLKPANIFLVRAPNGSIAPKVIDFGISKFAESMPAQSQTQTGFLLGTPSYMSPEQASGQNRQVDAQTDVWAMGVVLYEMLSGRMPFEAETPQLTLVKVICEAPLPLREVAPDMPDDVAAVVQKALTRDRAVRYATMSELAEALLGCDAARHIDATVRVMVPLERAPRLVAGGDTMRTDRTDVLPQPLAPTFVRGTPAPPAPKALEAPWPEPAAVSAPPSAPPSHTHMQWATGANAAPPRSGALARWHVVVGLAGLVTVLLVAAAALSQVRVATARTRVPVHVRPAAGSVVVTAPPAAAAPSPGVVMATVAAPPPVAAPATPAPIAHPQSASPVTTHRVGAAQAPPATRHPAARAHAPTSPRGRTNATPHGGALPVWRHYP